MWWIVLVLDDNSLPFFASDPTCIDWLLQPDYTSRRFAFKNTFWSCRCLLQISMFEILWGADYFLRIICIIVLHNVKLRYILQKSILLYKWMVNSHPWGLCLPAISFLRKWIESEKDWFSTQWVSRSRFASFDDITYMASIIICNNSNIVVFYVLT